MFVEKIFFGVRCNRCHRLHENSEDLCYFEDEGCAEDDAIEDEWINVGEKHYCPNCYDVVDGENVIKDKIPNTIFKVKKMLETMYCVEDCMRETETTYDFTFWLASYQPPIETMFSLLEHYFKTCYSVSTYENAPRITNKKVTISIDKDFEEKLKERE